jgi:hypothetical protein
MLELAGHSTGVCGSSLTWRLGRRTGAAWCPRRLGAMRCREQTLARLLGLGSP